MQNDSQSKSSPPDGVVARHRPGRWSRRLLVGSVVLLVLTFVVRWSVQETDGAIANILTLILGFFAWLAAVSGLALSTLSRNLWRLLAATPLVLIAVVLVLYRVDGFDGEIVPQLVPRWQGLAQLPTDNDDAAAEGVAIISTEDMAPAAGDFPQFLGPNRDGVLPGKLETNWNQQPPKVLWKQPIGAGWSGFATQGKVGVTLEQRGAEQWVSAYNIDSGKMYWHVPMPGSHFNVLGGAGPRSTPALDSGRVFAQSATGQVVCIDLASGQRLWQVDLLALAGWDQAASEAAISWGRAGSPLIVQNLVVLPMGGPATMKGRSLVALNKEDGGLVWQSGESQISYASPSLANLLDRQQIISVNETTVTGHEITTGRILWSVPWPGASNGSANVSQALPVGKSRLLISKGYSQGAKLVEFETDDQGNWAASTVWQKSSVLRTKFTSAVIRGQYAYGLNDGSLECVDLENGQRKWKSSRASRYGHGQVLLVDDTLLLSSEKGDLVLVAAQPDEFRELAWMSVLEGVTWNVPSLAGDRLLMRNADEAACILLPMRESR